MSISSDDFDIASVRYLKHWRPGPAPMQVLHAPSGSLFEVYGVPAVANGRVLRVHHFRARLLPMREDRLAPAVEERARLCEEAAVMTLYFLGLVFVSEGVQPALFELREDHRPASERTAAGQFREPSLFDG
jgi:hypothetical protein